MTKLEEIAKKLNTDSQTYVYTVIMTISWFIWIILVLRVRGMVEDEITLFYLGFIPNFFAAICMFFYFLFKRKTSKNKILKQLLASNMSLSVLVFVILLLGEIIQGSFLNGVFDLLDLIASLIGIFLSLILLKVLDKII